jgi:N-acetylneuraminic acid mutarotase
MSKQSVIPASRRGVTHIASPENVKLVETYAAVGISQAQIILVLGINEDTFRKYYTEIFNASKVKAIGLVAGTLFKKATEDKDLGAAIFYLKAQGGWRETPNPLADLNAFNIHIHLDGR